MSCNDRVATLPPRVRRSTSPASRSRARSCDADVTSNRDLYRHRATVLCDALAAAGWTVPRPEATMFVWAPLPTRFLSLGAVGFATELLEKAGVAVAPGVGFGPGFA